MIFSAVNNARLSRRKSDW